MAHGSIGARSSEWGAQAVDPAYVIAPFTGWCVAGSLKFVVHSLRSRRLAWDQVGLGGLPSTHTAVVSATAALIGLRDGIDSALFAIAVTLAMIVMLDAMHLRREVGAHAAALNELLQGHPRQWRFREHVGHRQLEVLTGLLMGLICALMLHLAFP